MKRETYTEVYEVLKLLGNDYINKLPEGFYDYLEKNHDPSFVHGVSYDLNAEPELSEEAEDFLTYINYLYFADESEKEKIEKMSEKNMHDLEEMFSDNEIFRRRTIDKIEQTDENVENKELEEIKESIFTKIINKIKNIFKTSKK